MASGWFDAAERRQATYRFPLRGSTALTVPPLVRTSDEEITRDATNGVDCALAMRAALAEMNAIWASKNSPSAQMRVGLCTGKVVAGSLGSLERLEYTVIGE